MNHDNLIENLKHFNLRMIHLSSMDNNMVNITVLGHRGTMD